MTMTNEEIKEKDVNCKCLICDLKFTLPKHLIDDGFFNIERYYCEKHVNLPDNEKLWKLEKKFQKK